MDLSLIEFPILMAEQYHKLSQIPFTSFPIHFCRLFCDVSTLRASNGRTDELETIWKEAVVIQHKDYPHNCLKCMKIMNNSVRLVFWRGF
jgi:hypothetical protein